MRLLKDSMMALTIALSSTAPYAHAETKAPEQLSAQQYLQSQLAELQDLKEQLAVVNKKKSTTKVVLYVSAGAMAAGPILALAQVGGSLAGAFVEVVTRTEFKKGLIDRLILEHGAQIGVVLLGVGTVGAVSSGGYLIYLNRTQVNQLEKDIAQIETNIKTTVDQLK